MYVNDKLSSVDILERLQNSNIDVGYSGILSVLKSEGVLRSRSEVTKHIVFTDVRQCKHCQINYTVINNAQVYCRICCPSSRAYNRLKCYNLSQPEFETLLVQQNHKCALCHDKLIEGGSTNLNVDHCHNTGKVRGLLCHRCNMIVGFLDKGDWPTQLHKIENYVKIT